LERCLDYGFGGWWARVTGSLLDLRGVRGKGRGAVRRRHSFHHREQKATKEPVLAYVEATAVFLSVFTPELL
jgi:hypothetical protein